MGGLNRHNIECAPIQRKKLNLIGDVITINVDNCAHVTCFEVVIRIIYCKYNAIMFF